MKKITIILAMLLFVTFSFAHDENIPHYVNMENPAGLVNPDGYFEYMIVKGDYLWMLSDKFYNDPYKWTDIDDANSYIVDPNWIYPNNWLVIPNVFVDDSG
ncbi:MAG: LysM peptidoglycan-binding domain-containing protein, partial [Planctomycetia bacterium]|nr:LysM peptidoglycan-binding domain-containing protein [Planctomycetia bacterium]